MTDYVVTVAAKGNDIVLRASGDLNAAAASHLLEMARLALSVRCSSVTIDLAGVDSCTPMADKLLARPAARNLLGRVTVRVGSSWSNAGGVARRRPSAPRDAGLGGAATPVR